MSLDTVEEDIRDEARARAAEILEEAQSRADDIVAEADSDAEEIRADREAEAERRIAQEREQELSSATLEAKQARLEARRDVLADVRERVEAEIAGLEGDTREELTRELLAAAREEFDPEAALQVSGRPEDADLLADVVADVDRASYAGEYDCLGGVVVESHGSRVRVNNTFDSVLEEVWEDNLREVSDRLFEDQ
jgi:V/A-type H+-transporting ATPase subunit E